MTDISNLMADHHNKIKKLLEELDKKLGENPKSIKPFFDKFKWELEKHLFSEEKAVFTLFNPKTEEDFSMIPALLKDHEILLGMLKEMEQNLNDKKIIDVSEFKKLLHKHKHFEEETLYPRLDQELKDEEKQKIIEEIKTVT